MLDLFDEFKEMVRSGLIYTSLVFGEHTSLYSNKGGKLVRCKVYR